MRASRIVIILSVLLSLVACTPSVPEQYIQPDEMEDILVDYHIAKAIVQENTDYSDRDYNQMIYMTAVLQKYGYTMENFDSSMAYYYKRADYFQNIYKRAATRLEGKALVLGASEGEMNMYASLDADGDTADIWKESRQLALLTVPPYNKWSFEMECDSTFKQGDSFLFQFMSDFMFQDGTKDGILYLAITYENDTTIARNIHFSMSGLTQLRFPENNESSIMKIRGFVYLNEDKERTTTLRLLFLNNIQLIRFHKQFIELPHEEIKKDSLQSDSVGERTDTEIVRSGDS